MNDILLSKDFVMWKKVFILLFLACNSLLLAKHHGGYNQMGYNSYNQSPSNSFADYSVDVSIGASIEVSSASTTYSTSGDRPFKKNHPKHRRKRAQIFIDQNMDSLAVDIAQGEGEYLDSFITILDIKDREDFKSSLQKNFRNIYSHDEVNSKKILDQILLI